jgi:hypothetical protein
MSTYLCETPVAGNVLWRPDALPRCPFSGEIVRPRTTPDVQIRLDAYQNLPLDPQIYLRELRSSVYVYHLSEAPVAAKVWSPWLVGVQIRTVALSAPRPQTSPPLNRQEEHYWSSANTFSQFFTIHPVLRAREQIILTRSSLASSVSWRRALTVYCTRRNKHVILSG